MKQREGALQGSKTYPPYQIPYPPNFSLSTEKEGCVCVCVDGRWKIGEGEGNQNKIRWQTKQTFTPPTASSPPVTQNPRGGRGKGMRHMFPSLCSTDRARNIHKGGVFVPITNKSLTGRQKEESVPGLFSPAEYNSQKDEKKKRLCA